MDAEQRVAYVRYQRFVGAIWWLRLRFPFSVTSWGRTPARNASLPGAVKDSQHLEFTAADVVFDAGAEPDAGAFVAAAREDGLEAHQRATYWHLELWTLEI